MDADMSKKHCTAIVLSAGSGKRMNSNVAKQYLMLRGKPIIWYSLNAVQVSSVIDECILVTAADDMDLVKKDIVDRYHFTKVTRIVAGGAERYDSVYNALSAMHNYEMGQDGYVFIHDGARPFLTESILQESYRAVAEHDACVVGMPVKDTIKIADENEFASMTPNRNLVWQVQTPQVFSAELAYNAYSKLYASKEDLKKQGVAITDDAMVVETMLNHPVKLVKGSYQNIKITTPEDLQVAEAFLNSNDK